MNNTLIFLLAMASIPAGYVVVNQVSSQEAPTIRELTKEEVAQPPIKLSEYQEQSGSKSRDKLPKGIEVTR